MMPSYYEKETEPSGNHALPQRRDKNIREIEKSIAKKLDYIYALLWICAICMNQVCVKYAYINYHTQT